MRTPIGSIASDPRLLGMITFTVTMLIQAGHAAEHVVQMLQKYVWHLNRFPGLLGVWFDVEWVHLLYNAALLTALLAVLVTYRKNPAIWRDSALAAAGLMFVTAFQAYHVLEHTTRVAQYLAGMEAPTPGILGRLFPVLEFHFLLNSIVTTAMIIAYVGFQPWRSLLHAPDATREAAQATWRVTPLPSVLLHTGGDEGTRGMAVSLALLVAAAAALRAALRLPRLSQYQRVRAPEAHPPTQP